MSLPFFCPTMCDPVSTLGVVSSDDLVITTAPAQDHITHGILQHSTKMSNLNTVFEHLDRGITNPNLLADYRAIIMSFQEELIRRGLKPEYLDRFVTVHYLPHPVHPNSRHRLGSLSSGDSDHKDDNNVELFPNFGDNFQCNSNTYPNYSRHNDRVTNPSNTDTFSAILADFKRMCASINSSPPTLSSTISVPPPIPLRSSVAPHQVPQYYAALSSATSMLSQLSQHLSGAQVPTTSSNDPLSNPVVNSMCVNLLNQLMGILTTTTTTSSTTTVVNSLPTTLVSAIPNSSSFSGPMFNPPPYPNVIQPPVVANPPLLSYHYPQVQPFMQPPQLNPFHSIEKLIPKFTAPYHLWAAQIRKLLYSKGFVNLRDPQLTPTVGASILNRLPSGAAIAAPWSDVETLLQFLEKYDKSKRDVCDIVGRDGKFNHKPSIHFFLKCTEIQQADTTNLTPHQIQSFAWQSMQRLFPSDMKSYIAMVSQGAALPTQEQCDMIDRLWNDSLTQRKQDSQRLVVTTSTSTSQVTQSESTTQITSPLEQAFYTLTKSLSNLSKNTYQQKSKRGNFNNYNNNNNNNDNSTSGSKSSGTKKPIIGVTLQERGSDLRRFPKPRFPERRDLCFYHQVYGPKATKCQQEGCKWDENARSRSSQQSNSYSKN